MKQTFINNNYFKNKSGKTQTNAKKMSKNKQNMFLRSISFYEEEIWDRWSLAFQYCKKAPQKIKQQQSKIIIDKLLSIHQKYPFLETYHFVVTTSTLKENHDGFQLYNDLIESFTEHAFSYQCSIPKKHQKRLILDILYLTFLQLKKIYLQNQNKSLLDINYNPLTCLFEHLPYEKFIYHATKLLFKD